jgi:hypothetical protein
MGAVGIAAVRVVRARVRRVGRCMAGDDLIVGWLSDVVWY